MIIGIGTDILQIPRVEKILLKYGEHFVSRILSEVEIQKFLSITSWQKQANFIAKRFAMKEAISKAFNIGIGADLQFRNIQILNDLLGAPYVRIESANIYFADFDVKISVSDDYPTALAFAVVSEAKKCSQNPLASH